MVCVSLVFQEKRGRAMRWGGVHSHVFRQSHRADDEQHRPVGICSLELDSISKRIQSEIAYASREKNVTASMATTHFLLQTMVLVSAMLTLNPISTLSNQITELPAAVDMWTELRVLSLSDNALAILPPQVGGRLPVLLERSKHISAGHATPARLHSTHRTAFMEDCHPFGKASSCSSIPLGRTTNVSDKQMPYGATSMFQTRWCFDIRVRVPNVIHAACRVSAHSKGLLDRRKRVRCPRFAHQHRIYSDNVSHDHHHVHYSALEENENHRKTTMSTTKTTGW